jgi:selenocysteine lyase/cysteine desulfurase
MLPILSFCYLNEAATSWPKPPAVVEAMTEALALPSFGSGRGGRAEMPPKADRCPLGPVVGECRGRLASLLKVREAPRVALVSSVTHALNAALWGIGLGKGGGKGGQSPIY